MIGDERYIDIPQHDPDGTANAEWLAVRAGLLTSSKIHAAISKPKPKKDGEPRKNAPAELAARIKLREALVFESITGLTMPGYVSEYMERGIELEDTAIMAYHFKMDVEIRRIGFVLHPTIDKAGASWDGYIPEAKRLVEIKCPAPHTHWSYLMSGEIPGEYVDQMMWQLACEPEMVANDFVSYCPQIEPQLFIRRLHRDNARIAEMEAEAVIFLAEVEALKAEKDKWLKEYAESLKAMRTQEETA